jgi:phage terminase Nu1 subunit (DNA packaging protein)
MTTKTRRLHLDRWLDQIIAEVSDGDKDELLERQEVADRLRVSTAWLDIARSKNGGYGPEATRLEGKGNPVAYRRKDVLAWLRARKKEKAQRDKQRELA